MKKLNVLLMALAITLAFGVSAFAYQYNLTPSSERLQSNYAASGTVDAAYYNPAGLTQLKDGLYIDLGSRTLYLTKTTKGLGVTGASGGSDSKVESKQWSPAIPNLAVAYKTEKGAFFYTLAVQDGGAGGSWDLGTGAESICVGLFAGTPLAGYDDFGRKVDASVFYLGHTIGGAYKLNDMISVGAGFRVLQKIQTAEIKLTNPGDGTTKMDFEYSEWGYTPLLGIMATPMDGLNIALQYQPGLTLEGTTIMKINGGGAAAGTTKSKSTTYKPAYLALGIGYTVMEGLDVSCSYIFEFSGAIHQDNVIIEQGHAKDTHKIGIGAQYQIMPLLAVSVGTMFQTSDTADKYNQDYSNAAFNQLNVGGGVVITPLEGLNVEVTVSDQIYFESKYKTGGTLLMTHNQNALLFGIGVNYKIL